jgi:hypothetical protein
MLLPQYWLRQQRLQRALRDYPMYDPPHKFEERLLPKEKALENFQYFKDVRLERVSFFNNWLESEFGIQASLEDKGVENLLDWAADYIAVIMPSNDFWQTVKVYNGYAKSWAGEYAGVNAYFDLGATLGEAIIRRRPTLRWQMEWSLADYPNIEQTVSKPTMNMLLGRQRDIRARMRSECSGIRRPVLASAIHAVEYEPVYGCLSTYFGLEYEPATVEYRIKTRTMPKGLRAGNGPYLRNWMKLALTPSASSKD